MARIRTLKREFFEDDKVVALSIRARLTFAGLICCHVDDYGRGKDDARLIRAAVWPLDDDVTVEDVAEDLREINLQGLIVRYDELTSGRRGLRPKKPRTPVAHVAKYLCIPSWSSHQKVSHPTKSKIPPPPAISRNLAKDSELFAPDFDLKGLDKDLTRTRARKSRAASGNGEGRVSHEDPKTKPAPKPIRGGAGLDHISDETRRLIDEAKTKTSRPTS